MKVKVQTFGSLIEILNKEFTMDALDTQELLTKLIKQHSGLDGRKLLIAVNNTIVQKKTILREGDIVALMPPYSGG